MNKNQKLLLGVAVVGVAGYFYWKSKQPKAAFTKVGLAGNAKAGFLAGDVEKTGTTAGVTYPKGGQFQTGAVQPLGAKGVAFKGFADQRPSGDAQFATFAKANMMGNAAGIVRNVPTEKVTTNAVVNPFFKVTGDQLGTPTIFK
jgi:hypothetical protein